MPLIATAGASDANSYCTVGEANTLLRLSMQPDLATAELQTQLSDALIWATRLIEEQVTWYWPPLTTTQALSWPAAGAYDSTGRPLNPGAIPAFLKQATAEYALALLRGTARQQAALLATGALQGLRSLQVQDVQIDVAADLEAQVATMPDVLRMPRAGASDPQSLWRRCGERYRATGAQLGAGGYADVWDPGCWSRVASLAAGRRADADHPDHARDDRGSGDGNDYDGGDE